MTPQVLDVLNEFGVKATFYVVSGPGAKYADYTKRAFDEGHEIAIHSACHDYKKIYQSKDAFFEDFTKTQNWIMEVTGSGTPTLQFRFPGGSSISKKWAAPSVMNEILHESKDMGAVHNDCNVSAGDATYPRPSKDRLIQNILPAAMKLTGTIAKNAPIAIRACKKAINEGTQVDMDSAIVIEEKLFGSCFETEDQREGMQAFLEKRKVEGFKNR